MKKSISGIFKEGILTNNPTFVQLLGMCPTLATTTSVVNALGMGAAVIVVLAFSNLLISLLRKIIPKQVRIASYIVIISGFVTAVELIIKAYFPAINKALGLFIPLIVVNCIILARAEAFASKNGPVEAFCQKNTVGASFFDGIFQGLGYTCVLLMMSIVREFLGKGTFGGGLIDVANGFHFTLDGSGAGIKIFSGEYGASILTMPFGGFLTLGVLIAVMQYALKKSAKKKELAAKAAEEEKEVEE